MRVFTNNSRARSTFIKTRGKGRNFMTPDIYMTVFCNKRRYVVELSAGTGFNHERIYGITVLERVEVGYDRSDLSRMFHSYGAAMEYMELLDQNTPFTCEGCGGAFAELADDSNCYACYTEEG